MRVLKKPWLDSYLDYVSYTENPYSYNLWSGISAISSTLKRRIYVWFHGIQFFPNQYVILVGPPGLGKGAAIKPGVSLAKQANTVNYLSDRITAEKIIETIAAGFNHPVVTTTGGTISTLVKTEHTATILAKELPVFLGSSDWMLPLLCQLWDENEFEHQTKNKGSVFIKDMCVSLLAGCVPDYIRSLTRDSLAPVTGGFTARCMFVFSNQQAQLIPDGWGKPNGTQTRLEQDLITDLQYISTIEGEMSLTPEARNFWNMKYKDLKANTQFESDALTNFKSRSPSHIIKCAIALSMSESDDLLITKPQLEKAVDLVKEIQDQIDITFRSIGESPVAAAQDRIMTFIEQRGITTREEILKYNYRHITNEQLSVILEVLKFTGFVLEEWQGSKLIYKHNPTFSTP
jgi:uncharacterized protein DUF3987